MKIKNIPFLQSLKGKLIKILVIEGATTMQEGIRIVFEKIYPAATIVILPSEEFPFVEKRVKEGNFQLVILGGSFTHWPPHPKAGILSSGILKAIKEECPDVKILFTSTDVSTVKMMEDRGADIGILKQDLADLILMV